MKYYVSFFCHQFKIFFFGVCLVLLTACGDTQSLDSDTNHWQPDDETPAVPKEPLVIATTDILPASSPRNLSTLKDPLQEQVRWAASGGANGPPRTTCDNHLGKSNNPIVVQTRGVGLDVSICGLFPDNINNGETVSVIVTDPNNKQDTFYFVYGQDISTLQYQEPFNADWNSYISVSFLLSTQAVRSNMALLTDNWQAGITGFSLIYNTGARSPLGDYTAAFSINGEEVDSTSFKLGTCDCPRILVPTQEWRSENPISIEYTGFQPNETLQVVLFKHQVTNSKSDFDQSGIVTQRYSWAVQVDENGIFYQEIEVDEDFADTSYALLTFSTEVPTNVTNCNFRVYAGVLYELELPECAFFRTGIWLP
jgi:hypothetical protein